MKNIPPEKKLHSTNATPIITVLILSATAILVTACSSGKPTQYNWPESSTTKELIPRAQEILVQALSDPDPMIAVNAIEVVASTKQIRLMSKVRGMLNSQFIPIRFAAALAVGDTKYAIAQSQVLQLLNDQDLNVRIAAAYALYKLGKPEYFQVIRNALASKDLTVRANAVMLIGKTADKNTSKLLYAVLTMGDSDDKVRFQAVEAIATLKDEHIVPRIWAMLISIYPDVRVIGIRAMGALATTKAHGAIIGMLEDSVLEVRLAAAQQLGTLGDPAGELVVLNVFRKKLTAQMNPQETERVYVFTAMAIGRICTPKLTDFLPKLLKNRSKQVRLAAAKAVFHCVKPPKSREKPPR